MRLETTEARFAAIANDPNGTAQYWKGKTGKKIVGCAGLDIPEIIIEAAGMIPVVLLDSERNITTAGTHFQTHICGYVRSVAQQALDGKLSYIDEFVFADACHEIRMGFDLLPHITDDSQMKHTQFFYFPPMLHHGVSQKYLRKELEHFVSHIEDVTGISLDEAAMKKAISIYNVNRRLLTELYDIRRTHPGIISATFISNVVAASMCMPKAEHSLLVKELIELLMEKVTAGYTPSDKVPVIISGSLCEPCDSEILTAAETTGGVIVDDDLFVGSRYFNTLFNEEMAALDAIEDAYCNRVSPCPTRYEGRDLGSYELEMAKRAGAKGVINVIVKHCEPHYYNYFTAHQTLSAANFPELLLESELENSQAGQIRTRMQSFFESLEG